MRAESELNSNESENLSDLKNCWNLTTFGFRFVTSLVCLSATLMYCVLVPKRIWLVFVPHRTATLY